MDERAIKAVVDELKPLLIGRRFGKVFQLSLESFAIDFGLRDLGYLFLSVEPALSRFYLIKRRLRDLEKQSVPSGQFPLLLKKELPHAELIAIDKDEAERVIRLKFLARDDFDRTLERTLVIQLTGRAANVHVLDDGDVILAQARPGRGPGQIVGAGYHPPPAPRTSAGENSETPVDLGGEKFNSVSEALDAHYAEVVGDQAFDSRVAAARARLRKQLAQARKLLTKLDEDRNAHADFEKHKRAGDLILANVSTAKRSGDRVTVIDYFTDGAPEVEIEVEENLDLPEAASRHFAKYSRSKRALEQIAKRTEIVKSDLAELEKQQEHLEKIIAARDEEALATCTTSKASFGSPGTAGNRKPDRGPKRIPGTRQYISADGFEILVGRAAHDNDNLTFKIARPNDLWLHAADYPGSHVIVRNPTRKDLPHRTLMEAAQLAAYFSQANKDPKVDVHYVARKFVAKIRGAAPGLVRLTRQKSITVKPGEAATRIKT
jgi:predicted ribosome quality control (RQC) complex YloA/Tae2 family protein